MDRIPAHAVLNESVELCRAAGQPHAAGMVNAVLRKLAATQKPGARIFESPAAFAERLGHPRWLVERWVAAYGRDAALAICEYDQREPHSGSFFPSLDPGGSEPAPSAAHPSHLPPQMDDGSRLVAEIAAAALPFTADRPPRIWDCCAAPGGKTLLLALRQTTAEILATDISPRRLAPATARLRRCAYAQNVRSAVLDASTAPAAESEAAFDLILCDVPCSGTGTLARNPEIRHRLRPEDFTRQAVRQCDIFLGAARCLAPGGRLVYSTCSLEPEENEQVVVAAAATAGLRRIPVGPFLEKLGEQGIITAANAASLANSAVHGDALRTLPGTHPCDGFFAAVFERN
jgi:16S rRNA (cytosine967-C5)-methyltransferase